MAAQKKSRSKMLDEQDNFAAWKEKKDEEARVIDPKTALPNRVLSRGTGSRLEVGWPWAIGGVVGPEGVPNLGCPGSFLGKNWKLNV